MLDFSILLEALDDDECQEIFGEISDDGRQWRHTDEALQAGVRDGLAFLFRTVGIAALMGDDESTGTVADRMVTTALKRAGHRDGLLVESVSLDIEATNVGIPELLDELESGGEISPGGLYLLMESEGFDTSAVQDCLREQLREMHSEGN
jgi:hypothetical protein